MNEPESECSGPDDVLRSEAITFPLLVITLSPLALGVSLFT